jgi:Na+-transporting NADH:ubiquinone oxidoreductase subunit C
VFSAETKKTLQFTFILCFICALILSSLAITLQAPQEKAKRLNQSQQMLLSAQILNFTGSFQLRNSKGHYVPAYFNKTKLVQAKKFKKASAEDTLAVFSQLIHPALTNSEGDLFTFAEANVDYHAYIAKNQKTGFSNLPLKLLYVIGQNDGYVIPINGFGLWDAIYGYLALDADADTVLGATWYQQAETAGLGANITLPEWQAQFEGKLIFQPAASGITDFRRAPLGITVVKGKVSDLLGNTPKSKSAVDGISGATLTGKGVTDAYADCLAPYRPFLLRVAK